mmetsp:Transcript_21912/g.52141  ORF Transcript_21912/g.52141 Transcript_21912/m.52141 type:complete len:293 (+) Transcript_21912:685-1563(+)
MVHQPLQVLQLRPRHGLVGHVLRGSVRSHARGMQGTREPQSIPACGHGIPLPGSESPTNAGVGTSVDREIVSREAHQVRHRGHGARNPDQPEVARKPTDADGLCARVHRALRFRAGELRVRLPRRERIDGVVRQRHHAGANHGAGQVSSPRSHRRLRTQLRDAPVARRLRSPLERAGKHGHRSRGPQVDAVPARALADRRRGRPIRQRGAAPGRFVVGQLERFAQQPPAPPVRSQRRQAVEAEQPERRSARTVGPRGRALHRDLIVFRPRISESRRGSHGLLISCAYRQLQA